jgi:amidase
VHYLSLAELSHLIRRRAISPVEIVRSQAVRIRELDATLHAYALVLEDSALAQARTAEAEILAGNYRGPLHGVPIAVKDLFFTKGVRTQGGLKVLAGHIPDCDAAALDRLKQAGAILIGKLHTTEGAMDGYHRDFPIPRNPWAHDRWPGVSSSGSGVAVAAGLCYASLATDTGGSIRIPAAANGVVGLKPTSGTVSTEGVLPLAPSLDHVGPIARSVADAAILFEGLAALEQPSVELENVTIGFDENLCTDGVEPYVTEAVRQAVHVFESRGAGVVPAALPGLGQLDRTWYTIAAAEAALAHRQTFPLRQSEYGEGLRAFLDYGRSLSTGAYHDAQKARAEWSARIAQCFRDFDVLACPALPGAAFRYDPEDACRGPEPAAGKSDGIPAAYLAAMNRLMLPFNLNGYPALCLPCGISPDGLPVSLQLVGRAYTEPLLILCGSAFEHETAWHLRRPPV